MKFTFYCAAATSGGYDADRREATYMACIAYGMRRLGYTVGIVMTPEMWAEPRMKLFEPMRGEIGGIEVCPARVKQSPTTVSIKTTVNLARDDDWLKKSAVYVARECRYPGEPNVISVPFVIHDRLLEDFVKDDMLEAYLNDDLEAIRERYKQSPIRPMGFLGCGAYGRKEKIATIKQWMPSAELHTYDSMPASAVEHFRFLSSSQTCLLLTGDSPKSNRFSEIVLAGRPIVTSVVDAARMHMNCSLTNKNAILLNNYSDEHGFAAGLANAGSIVAAADQAYKWAWSSTGQARSIANRLMTHPNFQHHFNIEGR